MTHMLMALLLSGTPTSVIQGRRSTAAPDRAKVMDAFGTVQKKLSGATSWQNVSVGDVLAPMTTLKTGEDSAVLLMLPRRHVVRVGAGTTVELKELGRDNSFSFGVLSGHIWSFVRPAFKPAKYEVETPSAVVGVSGTLFSVHHDTDSGETMVSADDGTVHVNQDGTTVNVRKGLFARFRRGGVRSEAMQQPAQLRQMWRMMRQQEGWARPRAVMKMDRAFSRRLHVMLGQFHRGFRRNPSIRRAEPGGLPIAPPERIAPRRPRRPIP